MNRAVHAALAALAVVVGAPAIAQTKAPAQVVKAPVSQAWIDVATFAGFGMPMGGGGGSPMSMMGGMFGGGQGGKNTFGMTQTGSAGRWVDVTLYTSRNPSLPEATQAVPAGTQLAPTLKLVAPKVEKGTPPPPGDDTVVEHEYERPKGKMYLYWGCGDTVRAGQPRVLDMATARPEEYGKFFTSRRATQRGAHSAPGRPLWPNEVDSRMVPANASLVGEHAFTGQGVPEGFKFAIGAQQDLMPAIDLKQSDAGGATQLEWAALPTARAYFIAAMGAKGGSEMEMVFWTSSEVPEVGMGLDRLPDESGGRPLAEGKGAARTERHEVHGAEGHLRRRWRRDAAHDRVRLRAQPRASAAPDRPEGRLGATVGGQAAGEERVQRDAGHGHERNAAGLASPGAARSHRTQRPLRPSRSRKRRCRTRSISCAAFSGAEA